MGNQAANEAATRFDTPRQVPTGRDRGSRQASFQFKVQSSKFKVPVAKETKGWAVGKNAKGGLGDYQTLPKITGFRFFGVDDQVENEPCQKMSENVLKCHKKRPNKKIAFRAWVLSGPFGSGFRLKKEK